MGNCFRQYVQKSEFGKKEYTYIGKRENGLQSISERYRECKVVNVYDVNDFTVWMLK